MSAFCTIISFFAVSIISDIIVDGSPLECQPTNVEPNWPTFHVVNKVTDDPPLKMEHLNDANAIFEYKGIYHVMCQAGGGNWTHAVSNDLVTWYRVKDALGRGPKNSSWDRFGPCDGTASFPGDGQGVGPIIMYGPDCTDPLNLSQPLVKMDAQVEVGDYPRAAIARPADPTSPHLIEWVKGNDQVKFDGEPCSFPGKIWKSEVGDYWNMLLLPSLER